MKTVKYIWIALVLLTRNQCFSQTWLPVGGGIGCLNGEYVWDLSLSSDSTKLLAAGAIYTDGECDTTCAVLSWDGVSYEPVAACGIGTEAHSVFSYYDQIYCVGLLVDQDLATNSPNDFNVENNSVWDTVPYGMTGVVMETINHEDVIYLTGSISQCGDIPCSLVCKYDGSVVEPVYTGPELSIGLGIAYFQDTLYVAGTFNNISTDPPNGIGKCCKVVNGSLERLGAGFETLGIGTSLVEFQDKLYIGGNLKEFGTNDLHTIYYYENGELHHLSEEPDDLVFVMKSYQGGLFVAGDFHHIGSMPCEHVARWDGLEWTCLCNDPFYILDSLPCEFQCIKDLEFWNDTLYVAGVFNHIGLTETKRIAKLDLNLSEAFPTSIDVINAAPLKIYPNPTNGLITLSGPPSGVEFSVRICDSLGQLVFASNNSLQIDISSFSAGIYFLHYQDQNRCSTISFIKQF